MSRKIFLYTNKIEAQTADESKFENYHAEARNRGWKAIVAENFPPTGFILTGQGVLVEKTEKQKVDSGEIALLDLIEARCDEVARMCRSKIIGGIVSSALGEPYLYPSEEVDQQNLAAKVISGRDGYFKCTKVSTGIKDWYLHSAAQFKSAFQDGDTYITNMLKNSSELQTSIKIITTYDGVKNFNIASGWDL